MSFKVGDRVKIVNEGRTGVIKDLFRSWPVRYLVLRDALFKGEKGRYASVSEQNLEHIDPAQYALNEGFNDYMKAAGYDSKEKGEAMDNLYYIVNIGCDDETHGLRLFQMKNSLVLSRLSKTSIRIHNMDVCQPFQFTRLMVALSGLLMIQIVLMIFCILTMPNMFWPNVSGDLDLMIVELS